MQQVTRSLVSSNVLSAKSWILRGCIWKLFKLFKNQLESETEITGEATDFTVRDMV